MLAPLSRRNPTISLFPLEAADINDVLPFWSHVTENNFLLNEENSADLIVR